MRKLPSSAEEGRAEAAAEARVVLVNEIVPLTSTTPAVFLLMLRPIGLALRGATPPQLRRGAFPRETRYRAV